MKKVTLSSLVFVLFTVVSASSSAETHWRFRRQALWHLVAVPAYYLVGVNIHEGLGHAVAISMVPEAELVSYRPYPHFVRRDDGTRNWLSGSFAYYWDRNNPPSSSQTAYIFLSPSIADISIFTAADLVLSLGVVSPRSRLGGMVFAVGMVGTWIDLLTNVVHSLSRGTDLNMAAEFLGIRPFVFTALGASIASIMLWRIILVGIDVLTEGPTIRERWHSRHERRRR